MHVRSASSRHLEGMAKDNDAGLGAQDKRNFQVLEERKDLGGVWIPGAKL